MPVAIRETAWRPFASKCKALSLILGLLLLSYPRPAQSAVPAAGAELNRLIGGPVRTSPWIPAKSMRNDGLGKVQILRSKLRGI
jgi:hypothetical protein